MAQKRHQTRLFLDGGNNEGVSGNVPPGTVVDTKIIIPLSLTSISVVIMEALGPASQHTIMSYAMKMLLKRTSCRSSYTICASLSLDVLNLFH